MIRVNQGTTSIRVDDSELRELAKGRPSNSRRQAYGRGHASNRIRSWIKKSHPAVFFSVLLTLLVVIICGPGHLLWKALLAMLP